MCPRLSDTSGLWIWRGAAFESQEETTRKLLKAAEELITVFNKTARFSVPNEVRGAKAYGLYLSTRDLFMSLSC
jgi:hypothetical protein